MQTAWNHQGELVNASDFSTDDWESLKQRAQPGEFLMPCCNAHAALKTSINGLHFFAHITDDCENAPETSWHKAGKAAVLSTLNSMGIQAFDEFSGQSINGDRWKADVLFESSNRTIVIELQRSYQHLRDFTRRQVRYRASGIECYWLVRTETFLTLGKATRRLLLKREFNNVFPPGGIGTGMLPELPVAILKIEGDRLIHFGGFKMSTIRQWLEGIVDRSFQYRQGSWNLG